MAEKQFDVEWLVAIKAGEAEDLVPVYTFDQRRVVVLSSADKSDVSNVASIPLYV